MKKIGVISIFIFIIYFNLISAQSTKTSFSETTCNNNVCETLVYSYEKYFLRNNQWEEIDEDFFDCSTHSQIKFCTKNYYFNVEAITDGTIYVIKDNQNLTFKLTKFANSNPIFNQSIIYGNLLSYQNILENVDLQYYYFPRKLKEEIVIKQQLNLNNDLQIEFSKSGNAQFNIEQSFICDAKDICIFLQNNINEDNLSLTVPLWFLNHPNLTYPIIIDPTITL